MSELSREDRINLALEAFNRGLFPSKNACAKAFDINPSTFKNRFHGISSRREIIANSRKLSDLEEETLKKWILDMAERGLPLQVSRVQYLAQILLSARLKPSSTSAIISDRWVHRFVQRHNDIQSKFTSRYDYQRAKCEDPETIRGWFRLVHNTIQKYGILEQDIYNMDETGFQMGVISTARVICGSETHNRHAKSIQPGNREWATIIIAINATGWALPPSFILAGKKHQSQWFQAIQKDSRIDLSDNGWTNNDIGLTWLQEIFEKHTASQTAGQYRLLILDGHGSHATPEFDQFCTLKRIIPLYMPPHSSHLLQPLDVACFRPLKHFYGQKVQEMSIDGRKTIDKTEFLSIYSSIHRHALSKANILSGFKATGLIPLNSESVISKLQLQMKTPTPPTSSSSNQSFYLGRTPANLYQLNRQKQQLQELQNQDLSSLVAEEALQKIMKGAEIAMQNAVLLQEEVHRLQRLNQQKNKRKAPRRFIQNGGGLSGDQALSIIKEREEIEVEASSSSSRPRRQIRCSNCGKEGHNRLKCPTR